MLDAVRAELEAHALAAWSRPTVQDALKAADRLEQAVAALVEAGHDVDPEPLAKWAARLRELLAPSAREDTGNLAAPLARVRAIQALPELASAAQLAEARELQERGERQLRPEPRPRRSRAAWSTRLHGIDRRHLPFGIRVDCDPAGRSLSASAIGG